jgi:hypothetical protein
MSGPTRGLLPTALAGLALAASPIAVASPGSESGVQPAVSIAKAKSSCSRLRGKDLAPAGNVKLVRRRNQDNGTDLLGCELPRGRVRTLASSSRFDTTTETYTIAQVSGAIVLLASSYDSQYASGRGTSVFDIRTGKQYPIASSCYQLGVGQCSGQNATAAAAMINARAQAAAAIVRAGTQITTIAVFSSRGKRQDLDFGPSIEVPASSLALKGSTVSWTHSGEPRSATLSS